MSFPSNLMEFQDRFPDEESCWRHRERRAGPRGSSARRVAGRRVISSGRERLEKCRCCQYQASASARTSFHRTRKPLRTWFLGLFFLARHKKNISPPQFQKDARVEN